MEAGRFVLGVAVLAAVVSGVRGPCPRRADVKELKPRVRAAGRMACGAGPETLRANSFSGLQPFGPTAFRTNSFSDQQLFGPTTFRTNNFSGLQLFGPATLRACNHSARTFAGPSMLRTGPLRGRRPPAGAKAGTSSARGRGRYGSSVSSSTSDLSTLKGTLRSSPRLPSASTAMLTITYSVSSHATP